MDQSTGLIGWIGGIVAVAGPIIGGFAWIEEVASGEAKHAASDWLKRSQLSGLPWQVQFLALFDRVFGKRLLSWKSFFRSALVSFALFLVLMVVWYSVKPRTFSVFAASMTNLRMVYTIGFTFVFLIGVNVPADYLTLIVARRVMTMMASQRSRLASLSVLISATVASLVTYLAVLVLLTGILATILREPVLRAMTDFPVGWFLHGFDFSFPRHGLFSISPSVFVYSSLFAVAWMWLFLVGGWSVRLLGQLDPGWQKLKWFLDIDEHPLRSLGVVAGVIGAVAFSIIKLVVT